MRGEPTPTKLTKGLATSEQSNGSVMVKAGSRVVGQVIERKTKGVRVNLRKRVKSRTFKPTRSEGQWAAFAYATSDNADEIRSVLEAAVKAERALLDRAIQPQTVRARRRRTRSTA